MSETKILNNRYTLEAELGRGGMGVVYRARDLQLDRMVAVKVLPPEFTHDTQFLARFKSEVRNTAKLQHQHIVAIYDVGVDGNTNYFVMQLIEGQDLKSLLTTRGRLPETEVLRYLGQIASALDYAHESGIVHRDIKPENILIDQKGIARVTDFGIARSMDGTRMTGGMIGTPEYMSPEQAQGIETDGRSDQYALAIVAYEMFTGTTPFRTSSSQPWAMVNMHVNVAPPDPRQYSELITDSICAALLRGLAKTAAGRYRSCGELVGGLSAAGGTYPAQVNRIAPPPQFISPVAAPMPRISPNSKWGQLGIELIPIPAGAFLFGENKEWMNLPDFSIMKYPVTVAQYRQFCAATDKAMPDTPSWGWQDNHPVVNVTWHEAAAFAEWAGLVLPTEQEWEKAARGTDGREYPWGNSWNPNKLQCSKNNSCDAKKTAPVGSFPAGASPYGVQDMAGNVWEWCNSWYKENSTRMLRGGSWYANDPDLFRATDRSNYNPTGRHSNNGFRCILRSLG